MSKTRKATRSGSTTDAIINFLNMIGFYAWRNNTTGVWNAERQQYIMNKRIKRGVADILGMDWNGRSIAVEIKIGDDRLSVDQTLFAAEHISRVGVYLIAGHIDEVIEGLRFYNYNITDAGYIQNHNIALKDRILDYADDNHIPNANKLRKLKDDEKKQLSLIASGGMGIQNLKLILGKYSERVI